MIMIMMVFDHEYEDRTFGLRDNFPAWRCSTDSLAVGVGTCEVRHVHNCHSDDVHDDDDDDDDDEDEDDDDDDDASHLNPSSSSASTTLPRLP